MADQVQELLEAPSEFAKSGIQFMRRCTKRKYTLSPFPNLLACAHCNMSLGSQAAALLWQDFHTIFSSIRVTNMFSHSRQV